jgi:hypothetical protein
MPNGHLTDYTMRGTATTPTSRLKPRVRQRPDPCEEPCTPRCPACGGLQCLCRPRFFPGQLLTDDDLNRLERYVVEKNKLHNRYLHGWGVACGLEVVCDPCDPRGVIVRTGYALSPCGDDIVVCDDQGVDVCDLIDACEPKDPVCEGPYSVPPADCRGGNDRWVLAICYDEKPVRGVTAQLGAGDTTASARRKCGGSSSCGCGGGRGSSKCGCGGGGGCGGGSRCTCGGGHSHSSVASCSCGAASSAPVNGRKGYKPQCEPTQICEGFRFMVYPAPRPDALVGVPDPQRGGINSDLLWAWLYANRARFGPLIERVLCCVTRAMELRASIRQGRVVDRLFAENTYRQYATALAEFANDFAVHRCSFVPRAVQLRDQAREWKWDSPAFTTDRQRLDALTVRVNELDMTWLEIVSECLCSALLPACPAPSNTNCVPLAVVTLQHDECRVLEICNWSERKLLITWPTVTYWLSWLPWERLRGWISELCCGGDRDKETLRMLTLLWGVVFSRAKYQATVPTMANMMASVAAGGAAGAAAAAGVAGAPVPSDPIAAAMGADNLLTHMLGGFEHLRAGAPEAAREPAWAQVVARLSEPSALAPAAVGGELAEMGKRLERAEQRLQDQDREITRLKKKVR